MSQVNLPFYVAENPEVIALIDDFGLVPSAFYEEFEIRCESWRRSLDKHRITSELQDYYELLNSWRNGALIPDLL